MFHPYHGGAHDIVWHTMTHTVNFASNVSTWDETQVFFNTQNQFQQAILKHHVDLMKLFYMTVNHSNVTTTTMFYPGFQVTTKTSTKCLWTANILYKPIYQYQLHSTWPIQNAYH